MPIYEYKCESCQKKGEYLQKINAAPPEACLHCGGGPLTKQISLTSFALKGSGWYVTDFRDGNNKAKKPGNQDSQDKEAKGDSSAESSGGESGKTADSASTTKAEPETKAASSAEKSEPKSQEKTTTASKTEAKPSPTSTSSSKNS